MPTQCKDGDGNIIIQKEKILEIWKEYFRNLFEVDGKTTDPVTLESIVDDNQEITPPTFNEICSIINKLKNNKAAGSDNICPELIKYGGRTLKYKMYKLIFSLNSPCIFIIPEIHQQMHKSLKRCNQPFIIVEPYICFGSP